MENNIQQKNELSSKQTNSPQQNKKLTVFFVAALILSLSVSIGIFSSQFAGLHQTYLSLNSRGYCQSENFVNNFTDDFGCFDPRVRGGAIIKGIQVIVLIIFSSTAWLLWRKSNNSNKRKKILIVYIAGSVLIYLLCYSVIWLIFNALYST